MELNVIKAIAVLIGLVLLWLVVKPRAQGIPRGGYPGSYPNNYFVPTNNGYPYPNGDRAPRQNSGCLQVLAVIGFLAVCAACVMIGIALASRLPL